ncbi:MAG: DUF4868 domain-containing protein [Clostridium sp.]|nr:DUF4868 domain-containing protein [Clostridium sp.]
MSLTLIKSIFEHLPDCHNWSAHLLSFHHSSRQGTSYNCRFIELEPQGRLYTLIKEISESYSGNGKNNLSKYTDVRNYDGTCIGTTIYKIPEEGSGVTIDLDALLSSVANTDRECDPLQMKANAYILSGQIMLDNNQHQIKLISIKSPITTLKHKFLHRNNRFAEITDKVLNLSTIINVIIYDWNVYFLDMSGESLFNMERAYRQRCTEAITEIESLGIVSDIESFRNIASSGHNPRRFTSFSREKLNLLQNVANRRKVKSKFGIPLTANNRFDTADNSNAEKLVKVLCNKAMWDILEDTPVEVDGSKSWVR